MSDNDLHGDETWLRALASGFLAGGLSGELFLGLGLLRAGDDLFVTSLTGAHVAGLVLRSVGLYGFLFAAAGTLLTLPLKLLGRRRVLAGHVFAVVWGILGAAIAASYLTVRRQIDDFSGRPMNDPERWSGAVADALAALLLGVALAVGLAWLGKRRRRSGYRPGKAATLALAAALLASFVAGEAILGGASASRPEPPRRVVVIGLDGMTFRVLSPLLRSGRLPAFRRLIEEGAWGSIMTYGTASSARIWTSLATGKRSRDHGIDDFVKVGSGYQAVPFKSTDRKVKAIWNMLTDLGRRVAIVDWHFTFPPEAVSGAIVSRLHLKAEGRTFPPELEDELSQLSSEDDTAPAKEPRDPLPKRIQRTFDVGNHFVGSADYDLVAIYDSSSDTAEHRYWKHHEPEAFDTELWQLDDAEIAAHASQINDVYEAYDRQVGELLDTLSDDTLLIVISDHGQRAARRPKMTFFADRLLADLGFASLDGDDTLDLAATRAFKVPTTLWKPTLRINLNLVGREPRGTVEAREAESLRWKIVDALDRVRFADGRALFRRIESEPIGQRRRTSADIELFLADALGRGGSLHRQIVVRDRVYELERYLYVKASISGNHDRQGVLFLRGPGVRPRYLGQKAVTTPLQEVVWNLADKVDAIDRALPPLQWLGLLDRVTTLDLTPMVLHALGEKVARDMSGSPRTNLWRGLPQVQWIETYETGASRVTEDQGEASDAEELERLRALGYVD